MEKDKLIEYQARVVADETQFGGMNAKEFGGVVYIRPYNPRMKKYQGEENGAMGNDVLECKPIIPGKMENHKNGKVANA